MRVRIFGNFPTLIFAEHMQHRTGWSGIRRKGTLVRSPRKEEGSKAYRSCDCCSISRRSIAPEFHGVMGDIYQISATSFSGFLLSQKREWELPFFRQ